MSNVILVVPYLGFEGGTLFLIVQFPGHCLPFTFLVQTFDIHRFINAKYLAIAK